MSGIIKHPEAETVPASLYRALRQERDELAERLRQLEGDGDDESYDGEVLALMRAYRLTRCEAHVIWRLMRANRPLKYEVFDDWPTPTDLMPSNINTYIFKIRKKLAPHGLELKNHWGQGYYVDAEAKAELRRVASAGRASA